MKRLDLIKRVRANTRDLSNSIFREQDIIDYINEAIDRFKQYIPELVDMEYLYTHEDIPKLLPLQYHHLLAVYATSRCFGQDERHYQATTFMNEFETKIEELKAKIEGGEITVLDKDGNMVEVGYNDDYVKNDYFEVNRYNDDEDWEV